MKGVHARRSCLRSRCCVVGGDARCTVGGSLVGAQYGRSKEQEARGSAKSKDEKGTNCTATAREAVKIRGNARVDPEVECGVAREEGANSKKQGRHSHRDTDGKCRCSEIRHGPRKRFGGAEERNAGSNPIVVKRG